MSAGSKESVTCVTVILILASTIPCRYFTAEVTINVNESISTMFDQKQ